MAPAAGAGEKVLGDSGGGRPTVEVEPRVRERLFQGSREFEKGRQSRPAPWSRLTKRRRQGGAAREGAGRWGARGARSGE